jgi:hypothetical protein
MASIPFSIDDSRGHTIGGLLFLEAEFVVFEIQVQKWGLYKEPVETVKAELGVIDSIRFEQGFFKDRLYLVPKRAELLAALPGDHTSEIKLKVNKRYRAEAQQFVLDVLQKKREQKAA